MTSFRSYTTLLFAALVVVGVAGCGGSDTKSKSSADAPTTSSTATVPAAVPLPAADRQQIAQVLRTLVLSSEQAGDVGYEDKTKAVPLARQVCASLTPQAQKSVLASSGGSASDCPSAFLDTGFADTTDAVIKATPSGRTASGRYADSSSNSYESYLNTVPLNIAQAGSGKALALFQDADSAWQVERTAQGWKVASTDPQQVTDQTNPQALYGRALRACIRSDKTIGAAPPDPERDYDNPYPGAADDDPGDNPGAAEGSDVGPNDLHDASDEFTVELVHSAANPDGQNIVFNSSGSHAGALGLAKLQKRYAQDTSEQFPQVFERTMVLNSNPNSLKHTDLPAPIQAAIAACAKKAEATTRVPPQVDASGGKPMAPAPPPPGVGD